MDPNNKQQKIIDSTNGIYVVDAGPGTGKTFTITKRYSEILQKQDITPEDIFLATFTNNAADEMTERIIQETGVDPSKIYDAPISTFHGYCKKLLELYGYDVAQEIGINEYITEDLNTIESHLRETQYFNNFYSQFKQENSEYNSFYSIIDSPADLLQLMKNLASRGIIPKEDGWFSNTGRHIEGKPEEFKKMLKSQNKPVNTDKGYKKQSELRRKTYSLKWKNFEQNAPKVVDIRGEKGSKKIREDLAKKAFKEDNDELRTFLHDIYYAYLNYSLQNNFLNFNFLLIFAYLLLYQNKTVRDNESFEYMMIDEFQDTNEIQLKTAMLLAKKPNICVVGDWKQSIYSFQHASIENILNFEQRIKDYKKELNYDQERIEFSIKNLEEINLDINYRSSQKIIDVSEKSFSLPANYYESLKKPEIESYDSHKKYDESVIEKIEAEDEGPAILSKIQEIVDNPDYELSNGETPSFSDIAILTRTRSFGVELQEVAEKHNVPASYEGGIELFRKDPAIILLAWLRATSQNSAKGWSVILENAGYNIEEVKNMLNDEKELDVPEKFIEFKQKLEEQSTIAGFTRVVFDRYGYSGPIPNKTIQVLQNVFVNSYLNKKEIIEFIEENIDQGEIYEIDNTVRENSINIMTLHGSKGLEFPIVFISDINQSKFPSTNSYPKPIDFNEVLGLRQRKVLSRESENGVYVFDNWKSELLFNIVSREYDEERRLMYVGMTRAEDHLFFSADSRRKSTFFTKLDVEEGVIDSEPVVLEDSGASREVFRV